MIKDSKGPQETEDDCIDLSLLVDAVRQHWLIFMGCLLGAVCIAFIAYLCVPPRWSASATLRIGAVASFSLTDADSKLIESLPEAEATMHLSHFESAVFASPKFAQALTNRDRALYRKTLKVEPVRGTNLLGISAAATSPETARGLVEAAVITLIAEHNEKLRLAVQPMRMRLQSLNHQIAAKEKELAQLRQALPEVERQPGYGRILAIDVMSRLESNLQQLTDDQFSLQSQLAAPQTYETVLMDVVKVGAKPYFPRLSVFLIIAIVVGGLAGGIASLFLFRKRLALA